MVLKPDFFDVPMNFQLGRVIAGFSNKHSAWLRWPYGLEGNRIVGFSNLLRRRKRRPRDWEGNRIAGHSNAEGWEDIRMSGSERNGVTRFSNDVQYRS